MKYGKIFKSDLKTDKNPPPCINCREWVIDRCAETRKECNKFLTFIGNSLKNSP